MADFFDQAQAIWKALDEMSAKDPEEYKRFISEQLKAGKSSGIMKEESGKQPKSTEKKTSSHQGQGERLEEVLGKLSLQSGNPIPPSITKEKAQVEGKSRGKSGKSKVADCSEVNLLDDEICEKSMLSSIVKKTNQQPNPKLEGGGDADDGPEVTITELRIPSTETVPARRGKNKSAPLIEEI